MTILLSKESFRRGERPVSPSKIANQKSQIPLLAFTLLEVMIASGIFFMCIFWILAVLSPNLRNSRLLQEQPVDAGMLLADLCQTNQLKEGSYEGDFGDVFRGYKWSSAIRQVGTNGFFGVDYTVTRPQGQGGPNTDNKSSALFYRPDSPAGAGF